MKHGLMYYLSSGGPNGIKNMGDYIQSLAADQFMHATELIERETFDTYAGDLMKVILNGWFMHRPEAFPPSSAIVPLFVSFHVRPEIEDRLLTDQTVAYLKEHGPVGCRDRTTLAMLEKRGIPAYFSNCLTLTLGQTYHHGNEDGAIVFVDPLRPFSKADIRTSKWYVLRHPAMAVRIYRKLRKQVLVGRKWSVRWKRFREIGAFLRVYRQVFSDEALLSADYMTHAVPEKLFADERAKFAYADRLLRRYEQARLCVTTRIHCALPCLAMGTPVVFVNAKRGEMGGAGRLSGLIDLFNVVETDGRNAAVRFASDTLEEGGRIGLTTEISNSDSFRPYADRLSETCRAFVGRE